ncbi:MAG: hypothetical protein JNL62_11415 [Bryobacterales bacterium]|nr:hypothetical protein [Bryobacterales bacterium]
MNQRMGLVALWFSCLAGGHEITPWLVVYHPADVPDATRQQAVELAAGSRMEVRVHGANGSLCVVPQSGCVWVRPAGTGEALEAAVLRAERCGRMTVQLPRELPLDLAEISLTEDGVEVARPARVLIVRSRFGILEPERVPFTRPLRTGSILRVTGTGLGVANREEIHGELDGQSLQFLGVERTDVTGLETLRFRIPEEVSVEGCYTPMAVRVAERWSAVVPLAVRLNDGPCRHPLRLTEEQLGVLDAGGMVARGGVSFFSGPAGRVLGGFSSNVRDVFDAVSFSRHEEGCRVTPLLSAFLTPIGPTRPLDAGAITVRKPDGGVVATNEVFALAPGEYVVKVSGGSDVMPVEAPVKLPRPPVLPEELRRAADGEVTVRWEGADYAEGEVVYVSIRNLVEFTEKRCKARARDGVMRVPVEQGGLLMTIGVSRRSDAPLLFPFRLRNGVEMWGMVSYEMQETQFVRIAEEAKTGN